MAQAGEGVFSLKQNLDRYQSGRLKPLLSVTCTTQSLVWDFSSLILFLKIFIFKGKRHVYPNGHRSTVYNSQDMEAT